MNSSADAIEVRADDMSLTEISRAAQSEAPAYSTLIDSALEGVTSVRATYAFRG
jgi:hypothetical protein